MILPGFPVMVASSGLVLPPVTVTRASLDDLGYGYIQPGGIGAGNWGVSGGSISGTLVPGYVTDSVMSFTGGSIVIFIVGNCEALLSGVTALIDNGTPLLLDAPFVYESSLGTTFSSSSAGEWSTTGNRTVQLV